MREERHCYPIHLVYALRKPFTAATFDGMELFGMDYKIATSIIQIFGYMVSKFIGIKLISELKREGRLKFILVSILVAELSLVLFGCLPRPFNVLALFFNGLSLGCMWGVIFSFLEGRRVTDLLASLFGLSIAVSSGTAKSIGLFVVDTLHVSEFWMPALIGAVALPSAGRTGLYPRSPAQTDCRRQSTACGTCHSQQTTTLEPVPQLCSHIDTAFLRQPLSHRFARCQGRLSGENHRRQCRRTFPWVFAKVDGVVTLIILAIFATLAVMKSHIKVLSVLLTLVIAGAITLSTVAFNYHTLQLSPLVWLFIQSLCLYFSYLSFQTIFFDRFIACFRIKGNVGFFIAMVDSIGYTGTVVVLVVKECFNPDLNWLEFYNTMAGTVGIVCTFAFTLAMIYLTQKYRKGKQGEIRGNESCPVPPSLLTNF